MRTLLPCLLLALLLEPVPAFPASKTVARRWNFPAPAGKRIVVDTSDMDVHLRTGDVEQIRIAVDAHISNVTERQADQWAAMHTPKISDSADVLRIETERGPKGILGHLTARAKLSIVAPTGTVPDLATLSGDIRVFGDFPLAAPLRLATMTGDVSFTGGTRSLTAIATSGKVKLRVVRPLEELIVRTTSGKVSFAGGSRSVSVDTASGNITLRELSGSARISTASGTVTLTWDRLDPGSHVVIRSTRGDVRLVLPAGVAPRGELRTVKGAITSDIAGVLGPGGTTLDLSGPGPQFDVETAKGDITLKVTGSGETKKMDPAPSPTTDR